MADGIPCAPPSPDSPWARASTVVRSGQNIPMSASPTRSSTGWDLLSQSTIATRKRPGRWWAPVEVGVDFVPDSQDGSGGDFIFIPDSEVDVTAFIQERKIREKEVEEEAMKAAKRDELQRRIRGRYKLLPPLEPAIHSYLLSKSKRGIGGELKLEKETEAHAMEHQEIRVDIGGHSQPEDDMLDDKFVLDNEPQPTVSSFSLTRSCSMFKSGTPAPSSAAPAPPPPAAPASASTGMLRSGSPPPGTSSSSKPGGLFRSNAMAMRRRVGHEEMK